MAQSVTIKMEDDLLRWLTVVATSRDVSVETLVREVLREARARSVNSASSEVANRAGMWLSRFLLLGGIALLMIGLALAVTFVLWR